MLYRDVITVKGAGCCRAERISARDIFEAESSSAVALATAVLRRELIPEEAHNRMRLT
jgi:hypothetical protein